MSVYPDIWWLTAGYPGIFVLKTGFELKKMYFNKNIKNISFLTFYLCYNQIYVCKKQKQRKMKGQR